MLLIYGLVSRALHVKQLLLYFLIGGGAFGAGRGSTNEIEVLVTLFTKTTDQSWLAVPTAINPAHAAIASAYLKMHKIFHREDANFTDLIRFQIPDMSRCKQATSLSGQ